MLEVWNNNIKSIITACLLCGNMSGAVHTRVEVHGIDSEMSGLVEQPWL